MLFFTKQKKLNTMNMMQALKMNLKSMNRTKKTHKEMNTQMINNRKKKWKKRI